MEKVDNTTSVLSIEKAETACDNLSDLLCWWDGFKTGLELNPDMKEKYLVAENGINQVRELRMKISQKII